MNKSKCFGLLASALLLAGTAFAQVDDRARELLEGMQPDDAIPEIRTMEQVMVVELSEPSMTTTTRTYVDMDNKRALSITESFGTELMLRYSNGVIEMVMDGVAMEAPPEMAGSFDDIFATTAFDGLLDDPAASASYDGVVSYADVLSGHQVTYTGTLTELVYRSDGEPTPELFRYIFADDGQALGTVSPMGAVDIVGVYISGPAFAGLPLFDTEMYEVEGDTATFIGTMRYETVSVNEPIDESLFDQAD